MNEWTIAQISDDIEITASEKYIWICGSKRLSAAIGDDARLSESRLARVLPVLIPQLLELDLATAAGDDIRIEFEQLVRFPEHEIDFFTELFETAPFSIQIKLIGSLGFPSSNFKVNFLLDQAPITPEVRGCLIKHDGQIYLLSRSSFDLLQTIEEFNNAPAERKTSSETFSLFSTIKKLASDCGAQTDEFTVNRTIVEPLEIAVDIIEEDDGRISLSPVIDGIDPGPLDKAVKRGGAAKPMYDVQGPGAKKYTVVLTDDQREIFDRITAVRHLGGVEKANVLSNPHAVFDGVAGNVNLDAFGPRVRGIGDFPFVAQPYIQKSVTGIFDDATANSLAQGLPFNAGLNCRYADGTEENIVFASVDDIHDFANEVEENYKTGNGQVNFHGKTIKIDDPFIQGIRELKARLSPNQKTGQSTTDQRSGKYLLIYTNEESLEFEQPTDELAPFAELEIPVALRPTVKLKDHQAKGVRWLQHNYNLGRTGCLLADDMGLGKTLQLLIFIAWLIEKANVVSDTNNPETPPWKPILIIAPVILIENETWVADMKTFFEGDGAVFMPWIALRGSELQRLKVAKGRETKIGEATLDLDKLRNHRVVLTNYETVINYQHSFAKMLDHWSVVITDEAQEYKTPNTKISHALKSLSPGFRVACTGTPVETKLFDIWNIFDFLQPGKLLGSARDFRDKYDRPLDAESETQSAIEDLKEKLGFGKPSAYLLRRDKKELSDLPVKREHRLECDLMETQKHYHLDLLRRSSMGGQGNHPFTLINEFLRVYQHPALVPKYNPRSPDEAINECDKLKTLISKLVDIKLKREKALIFLRSIDMQQILAEVLRNRFGLEVNIVNGSTKQSSRNSTRQPSEGDRTRRGIIDRFRGSPSFDVLILSPDVAGMGLTLTEANHVFHYGRWWNPAKEAQATDRVYRIGQEKDVHVYYLIAKDRTGQIETFDEKLDRLLGRRLALASDFLAPIPSEDELTKEFMDELFVK